MRLDRPVKRHVKYPFVGCFPREVFPVGTFTQISCSLLRPRSTGFSESVPLAMLSQIDRDPGPGVFLEKACPRLGSTPTSNRYEVPSTHTRSPASGLVLFALKANRTGSGAGALIVMGKGNFVPIARRCASQSRAGTGIEGATVRAHTRSKSSLFPSP